MNFRAIFSIRSLAVLSLIACWRCSSAPAAALDNPPASPPQSRESALPPLPPTEFDVRQFGAIGDGKTLNNDAFAKAITACAAAGGGTVLVPAGRYLTGAIELKSHVSLCIDSGATLLASQRPEDYPLVEYVWSAGRRVISSLIYAHDASDVSIVGRGTIDGQGSSWWAPVLAAKMRHRTDLPPATSYASTPDIADNGPGLPHGRPQLIRLLRCTNVLIQGITLLNSPEWNVHPLLCERVRIDGVSITAHVPSPNTDGINPESCRTVMITNCRIDNGDDCITLKSGLDEAGRRIGRPDEDITIVNCTTYNGHGGVTIGSEMSGGVHNVVVTNCTFHGTDNGIRIKSQRGRGGVVENICISNLVMDGVAHPIAITSFYAGHDKPGDLYPVNEGTPQLRGIDISNVISRNSIDAGSIVGLREMPVSDITLSNVQISADQGFLCTNSTDIHFLDCAINTKSGPSLTTRNCSAIVTDRLRTSAPHSGVPVVLTDPQK